MLCGRWRVLQQFRPFSSHSNHASSTQFDSDHSVHRATEATDQLSQQQQEDLTGAVLRSFRQDPATTAALLAKSLNEGTKRELLSAIVNHERPELSRAAMIGETFDVPDPFSRRAATADTHHSANAEVPTNWQLLRVAVTKGIPFVAFGFFDNIIMVGQTLQWLQSAAACLPQDWCCCPCYINQ
eukprot:GHRR01011662.1.p1 GENE.GHRR01011662.1~~GHRR01011662.1.p1  ORF type:complete len:184 (+),score=35.29 GHRR01011662.1:222-773(+)